MYWAYFSFWLCEEQVVPDGRQWFHLCWAVAFTVCPTAHQLGDPSGLLTPGGVWGTAKAAQRDNKWHRAAREATFLPW